MKGPQRRYEIKNGMICIGGKWYGLSKTLPVEVLDVDGIGLRTCSHELKKDRVMYVRLKQYNGYKWSCMSCGAEWVEIFSGKEKR